MSSTRKSAQYIRSRISCILSANYAHGFRQPTFGDLFISGAHGTNSNFFPNPDVKPERSRNLDVGLRVNLPKLLSTDDQFIFKGTYFRNQLKDRITFVQFCEDGCAPIPGFPQRPCANGDPVLNTARNVQRLDPGMGGGIRMALQ